ncbi:MAG: HAD superfamily hydrolase (TIGR01509 family) [Oleiphilaceae bacterium]|jgi:putative hydrolase of the HAD superfamily
MIDWNQIDTVFFDMDGTLLDLHFDNYFWLEHLPKRYIELKNASPDETKKRLHAMFDNHQGSLNWYCLDFWSAELDVDIVALKREVSSRIAYRPSVKAFLNGLHAKGLDIAIVTNAHQDSVKLKLELTDLGVYFDEIICSHDYNMPKESPDFWAALNSKRPFDAHRTIFFDDNDAVLRSAKDFGIKHLYSIAQPDSQKIPRTECEFHLVDDFMDLLT